MDNIFDVNYYRGMNPHLPKFMDARLTRYYKENPKEGVICNDYTFREKYPEFNILYSALFNNDIYGNELLFDIKCKYHINKKINDRIYSLNDFKQKYPDFSGSNIVDCLEYLNKIGVNIGLNNLSILYRFTNITFNQFNNLTQMGKDELINYLSKTIPYHRINIIHKNQFDLDYLYTDDILNKKHDIFKQYKTYYENKKINKFTDYYNLDNHEKYYNWIEKAVNDRKITIKSPKTGKIISTNKYFIISYPIDNTNFLYSVANYYFIDEDIVVGVGLGTGSFLAGMETTILYVYNHEDYTLHYSYKSYDDIKFKTEILPLIIKNMITMNITDNLTEKDEVITWYGYHNNLGHNLFNDITGLYILHKTKLLNKVDKLYIGENDPFFFHEYFYNMKNSCEIIEKKNVVDGSVIFGCGVVFKYNHYFISHDCVEFLRGFSETSKVANRNLNKIRNDVEIIKNSYERYPIINIVLRGGHLIIDNQVEFYTELINKILNIYPNAYFFFDGFCSNPYLEGNTILQQVEGRNISCNDFIREYGETYDKIVKNVWSGRDKDLCEVRYKSLIGLYSNEIKEYLSICDYAIYHIGSGCTISGWLCNVPGYEFGRINTHMYKYCDENVREDICEIVYNSSIKIETDDIIRCLQKNLMSK